MGRWACWQTAVATLAWVLSMPVAGAQDYDIPLASGSWAPSPGWTPGSAAIDYSHQDSDGVLSFCARGGGGTMIWTHYPQPPLDFARTRYLSVRYRAVNVDPTLGSYCLYVNAGTDSKMTGKKIALGAKDLTIDGEWHSTVILLSERGELRCVALRFAALTGREGRIDVARLRFTHAVPRVPISEHVPWEPDPGPANPVSISGIMARDLPGLQEALSLSDWFSTRTVRAGGALFDVNTTGPVAVSTDVKEVSEITFRVGVPTAEIHLLLGGQLRHKLLTYRNWENGDRVWRPTQFLATLTYADGTEDKQIPYCLDRRDYGIWRGLHAYGLSVLPGKTVRSVSLRDGMTMAGAFHLVAASVASRPLIPPRRDAVHVVPAGIRPAPAVCGVRREGDRLVLSNTSGAITLDLGAGAAVCAVRNHSHPGWSLSVAPAPLLGLRRGPTRRGSDEWELQACDVEGQRASLTYGDREFSARIRLDVEARSDHEFSFSVSLTNTGEEEQRLGLAFPQVSLTKPGSPGDLWYVYPRQAVAWSNRERILREPHNGQFPVQWMDVYDRDHGGGLYLMTRDTEARYRWYELIKEGEQVSQRVEYWDDAIAPGKTRTYPAVFVGLHGGDWRVAHRRYCTWVRTWCEPLVPRQEWFRRVWNFRTHWVRTMKDGDPQYNWYDPEGPRYRTDAFLDRDTGLFGPVGMNHFFDWRISDAYGRWGDYSHYEDMGSLPLFRTMVEGQQTRGVRVGLYLDTYLCSKKAEIGREHGEAWAIHGPNGRYRTAYSTVEDPLWNMCIWSHGWPEYLAETFARVARETGCDGVYLDEGGADVPQYWCWREGHGHPVPSHHPGGFRDLARLIRAALPPETVLYAEHCPPDVSIPYMDGGYITALGRSDPEISPGYLHIHRFAFPDFKVLPITSGGSLADGIYDGLVYSLFNGCALYTLSYGHDADAFPLIRRINRVLREHGDAFCSAGPEPYVATLREEVYCNRFPTAKETVWTLWNGRFRTVRGAILRVEHPPGATYRDSWNEADLAPHVADGWATLELTIGPRSVGLVCQRR